MSQDIVKGWLKAHPKKTYTVQELGKHLGLNKSIFANCRKMIEQINKGLEKDIKYKSYYDEYGIYRGKIFWFEVIPKSNKKGGNKK